MAGALGVVALSAFSTPGFSLAVRCLEGTVLTSDRVVAIRAGESSPARGGLLVASIERADTRSDEILIAVALEGAAESELVTYEANELRPGETAFVTLLYDGWFPDVHPGMVLQTAGDPSANVGIRRRTAHLRTRLLRS